MADIKVAYGSSASVSNAIASLASSSGLTAGYQSEIIDNTSGLYKDFHIGGNLKVGSSGVAAGVAEIWVIPILDDTNWPDVFDATESAETVTSREVLQTFGYRGALININAANDIVYPYWFSVLRATGGIAPPKKFVLFTVHNSSAALAASGHTTYKVGVYHTQA